MNWVQEVMQEKSRRNRLKVASNRLTKAYTNILKTNRYLLNRELGKRTKFVMRESTIYFIQCKNTDGFVKIGVSDNPEARVFQLQHACPYELIILRTVDGYVWHEKWLQIYFSQFSISQGEWFHFVEEMMTIDLPTEWKPIPGPLGSLASSIARLNSNEY